VIVLEPTPERVALLAAARNMELWQEDDQRTTNRYLPEVFGLSEPVCDLTVEVEEAYDAGLLDLVVGKHGGRYWNPTREGERLVARAKQEGER
jgi:hypothetical protein